MSRERVFLMIDYEADATNWDRNCPDEPIAIFVSAMKECDTKDDPPLFCFACTATPDPLCTGHTSHSTCVTCARSRCDMFKDFTQKIDDAMTPYSCSAIVTFNLWDEFQKVWQIIYMGHLLREAQLIQIQRKQPYALRTFSTKLII